MGPAVLTHHQLAPNQEANGMADLTESQLIAYARRAAKRRRDREYYQRHRDAINTRRRERYRETVEESASVDKEIQRGGEKGQ